MNRECFKLSVKTIFNKIGLKLRKLGAFDYFECQPTLKWTIYRTDRGIQRWWINYIWVKDEWNIWDEIITLSLIDWWSLGLAKIDLFANIWDPVVYKASALSKKVIPSLAHFSNLLFCSISNWNLQKITVHCTVR